METSNRPQELPVGSLLYGRLCEDSETAQLKTRQGRVNRYHGGAVLGVSEKVGDGPKNLIFNWDIHINK